MYIKINVLVSVIQTSLSFRFYHGPLPQAAFPKPTVQPHPWTRGVNSLIPSPSPHTDARLEMPRKYRSSRALGKLTRQRNFSEVTYFTLKNAYILSISVCFNINIKCLKNTCLKNKGLEKHSEVVWKAPTCPESPDAQQVTLPSHLSPWMHSLDCFTFIFVSPMPGTLLGRRQALLGWLYYKGLFESRFCEGR